MTPDEARELVIEGINYAAYRQTNSALHDSDKNRLFGSDHYKSDRPVVKPSPWHSRFSTIPKTRTALRRQRNMFVLTPQSLECGSTADGASMRC